jgi:hypothetical protein
MTTQPGTETPKRGRPKCDDEIIRRNRIVTFVTDKELARLEETAASEDRSMASLVNRIIKLHLSSKR